MRRVLEVFGNQGIQPLFVVVGDELLDQSVAVCVADIRQDLPAESALANRPDALPKRPVVVWRVHPRKLAAKALQVSECEFVDDADETIKLEQRVLQRCGSKERLLPICESRLDSVRNLIACLVDVPQTMSFVNDNEVPRRLPNVSIFRSCELVGAENDLGLVERIEVTTFYRFIERLGFNDCRWKEELVGEFLAPLFTQVGGTDDE
jgi:hypothetical protein